MTDTTGLGVFWRHLQNDRRYLAMLGLGVASGMPYLLVYVTQSAWLSEANVPLQTIGLMSWLTIAYKLKFLWAPLLDQYDPPLLGRWLGRRRGWIVTAQALVATSLIGIAFGDPANQLAWTLFFSLALGVAGATQDIVIDGWRITAVPQDKQALMTTFSETGYRIGVLVAGAGALYIAAGFGWKAAYLCMAAMLLPGAGAALLAPEPRIDFVHAQHKERPGLIQAIWAPIREIYVRLGPLALPILLLIAGFRMPGYISNAMAMPMFKALHYADADIATVTKMFGFGVALCGAFLCSWLVPRLGLMTTLLIGTVAGSASHLSLAWLAAHGGGFWAFAIAVSIDSFAYSFASVVLITFMSSLANAEFAGSQFALMTSLCAMPGFFLAGLGGFVVERTGFPLFFTLTSLIGLPVAALCFWLWRRHGEQLLKAESEAEAAA